MSVTEIRIAGFGGQGVILSAIVIGKAGCIYHNGYSTMTQSFGPEARGGACSAQVILSDSPCLYPYVTRPDILVVMSQEAYALFAPQVNPNGILDHRRRHGAHRRIAGWCARVQHSGHPHRRGIGQEDGAQHRHGRLLRQRCPGTGSDAVRNAVAASVPEAYRDLNLKAFDRGYEYGAKELTRQS